MHLYGIQIDTLGAQGNAPSLSDKYKATIEKETKKTEELKPRAQEYEKESEHLMHRHHQFSQAVTGIQVAIALGAVAALTHVKMIWVFGLAIGLGGLAMFVMGLRS
jgi:fatty acid desaturase